MKRISFVFMILIGIVSLCFADTTWKFESGSKELGYKIFDSVTIINRTGKPLQVENEVVQSDANATFQMDSILVSSDAYNSDAFEAICAITDNSLEVTFSKKGEYKNMTVEVVPLPGAMPYRHCARPVHRYAPQAPCPQPAHSPDYRHSHNPAPRPAPRPPRHHPETHR